MNDRRPGSLSDTPDDFEALLRGRLHELADQAPLDAVPPYDELTLRGHRREGASRRVIGIAASVAALAGAGVVMATVVDRDGLPGAASPLAVVSSLVAALEEDDVSAAVDLFDPLEVSAMRSVLDGVGPAAEQAAVLGTTLALGDLVRTSGPSQLTAEELASDLVVVTRPGGDVVPSAEPGMQSVSDAQVAAVRREGRWYVSLQYTIAEAARRAHGLPFPTEPAPVARGSASAIAAAEHLYASLVSGSFPDLAAAAAPGEGDAMLRYASLWVPAVQSGHDAQRLPGDRWTLSVLEMSGDEVDGRATLTPTVFVVEGSIDRRHGGEVPTSSEPIPFRIEHRDGCTRLVGADAVAVMGERWLPDGLVTAAGDLEACGSPSEVGLLELLSGVASGARAPSPVALPSLGLVEVGGSWYLSPLGTLAAGAASSPDAGTAAGSALESIVAVLIGGQLTPPITTPPPTTSATSSSTSTSSTVPVTTVPNPAPPSVPTSTTEEVAPSTSAPRPPSTSAPSSSVVPPPATVTPPSVTSPPLPTTVGTVVGAEVG